MKRQRARSAWGLLALLVPSVALAALQLRYDREYAVIEYSTATATDRVTRLRQAIADGTTTLEYDGKNGYLAPLLRALDIGVESQILVFSRTSFQAERISPQAPRAIYFNDDVYVAWVRGSDIVEIAAVDANLGVVFHTLDRGNGKTPRFRRHTTLCLECHDSYSLTGAGNLVDLTSVIDTDPYLSEHSDIVALMVIEHQTHVQNAIIRAGWDTRRAIHEEQQQTAPPAAGEQQQPPPPAVAAAQAADSVAATIARVTEPLVEALLMVDEARLTGPLTGTSGFAGSFAAAGPFDTRGRSLRQLDLSRRLLQYPCSYLIYSDSFDGLPVPAKDYVYRRLGEVLRGADGSGRFDHLSAADRGAILEILMDTKPDFAARQARH